MGRFHSYCYLVLISTLLLLSLNSATSRPLEPQGSSSEKQEADEVSTSEAAGGVGVKEVIGSRPPRCEQRCNGCSPCEAIQVPTNHHVGIQFTNYEPEGWKCKCGKSFFTP
nr:PREDICTED: EPIDERMAL PATTERNING FACTOR-like protein 2 [Daucus carota subsp. sativus]